MAENSGGAHCLKYGFTTHHVTGLEMVTPDGDVVELGGGKALDAPGYDLLGAFIGSEGTIGIATKVVVRLLRAPEAVETVLAGFPSVEEAADAVSSIIAAGIVPAAVELMDALAIQAAEAAVHCGYPSGAGAVLIVELDGPHIDVNEELRLVEHLCEVHAAFEIRVASSAADAACFGRGVSRPSPRWAGSVRTTSCKTVSSLAPCCRRCSVRWRRWRAVPVSGWRTFSTPATATCTRSCSSTAPSTASMSAPNVSAGRSWTYASDRAARSQESMAWEPTRSITCPACSARTTLTRCSCCGPRSTRPGSATRERSSRRRASAARSPVAMAQTTGPAGPSRRRSFEEMSAQDGAARLSPANTPAGPKDTVDGVPASYVAQPSSVIELVEVIRDAAERDQTVVARGGGTKLDWGRPPPKVDLLVDLLQMDRVLEHAAGDLIVRTEPGVRLSELQALLARSGQRLALDEVVPGSTVGGLVATGLCGPLRLGYGCVRDLLIGISLVRANGALAKSGGKVVKNVAGYDLGKLYTGSYGTLGVIAEAIFRLHPVPRVARLGDDDAVRRRRGCAVHLSSDHVTVDGGGARDRLRRPGRTRGARSPPRRERRQR